MSDEYWSMNAPICPDQKGKIVCPYCGSTLDKVLEVRKETSYMEFPVEYDGEADHYEHYETGHEIHHDLEQITEHRCPNCDEVIAESEDELKKLKDPLRSAVASTVGD